MIRALRARSRFVIPIVAMGLAAAACAQATNDNPVPQLFPVQAATVQGRLGNDLYNFVFVIATLIFILVAGLILYAAVRYRRQRDDDTLPPQTHGHMFFELAWTIIPFLIVVVLFLLSYDTEVKVDARAANPDLTVDVTGFQWQWTFDYKDQGLTFTGQGSQGPTMVLPVGKTIHFRLHSNDVIHSFYVPGFFFKRDVIPGVANAFDVTISQPGTYSGQCAEFCGLGHAQMRFSVEAVSANDFSAWVKQAQQAARNTPSPPPSGAPVIQLSASSAVSFDETTLQAPANQTFVVAFTNKSPPGVPHNFAIPKPGGGPGDFLFNGQPLVNPGQTVNYTVPPLPPGTYTFMCVVHPNMTGTLKVQ